MKNTQHISRGYFTALLSAAILSTTAILIRYLTQNFQLPALILAFWRDVFVTLSLIIGLGLLSSKLLSLKREHLPYMVAYGFILAAFNALWTLSVALNGAAVSTVLVYSSVAFTAILGWLLLKERMNWVQICVILATIAGCILVAEAYEVSVWQTNLLAIFTGIISGLGFAAYPFIGSLSLPPRSQSLDNLALYFWLCGHFSVDLEFVAR